MNDDKIGKTWIIYKFRAQLLKTEAIAQPGLAVTHIVTQEVADLHLCVQSPRADGFSQQQPEFRLYRRCGPGLSPSHFPCWLLGLEHTCGGITTWFVGGSYS